MPVFEQAHPEWAKGRALDLAIQDAFGFQPNEYGALYFHGSLELASDVEKKVAELGLQEKYIDALLEMTGAENASVYPSAMEVEGACPPRWDAYQVLWALVHATAEQRCNAALKAIEVK
jgi:hypothetical protein